MSDEIILDPQDESVRAELYEETIDRIRDRLLQRCENNCTDGFIEKSPKIKKIEDLAESYVIECTCRKRADLYAKYIYSGVPKEFFLTVPPKYQVDAESQKKINLYTSNLKKIRDKGIGLTFFGSENKFLRRTSYETSRVIVSEIMKKVIAAGMTTHLMSVDEYYAMVVSFIKDPDEYMKLFHKETMNVDFLFLDGIDTVHATDYKKKEVTKLLSHRKSMILPTLYFTAYTEGGICEDIPDNIFRLIMGNTAKICFTKCKLQNRGKGFVDLKVLEE